VASTNASKLLAFALLSSAFTLEKVEKASSMG
jgi:hypothetical protein